MTEELDPADLRRLTARRQWAADTAGATDGPTDGTTDDAARARRAECAAARTGHLAVVLVPGETPRCDHCGAELSPDALRRAGIKALRP